MTIRTFHHRGNGDSQCTSGRFHIGSIAAFLLSAVFDHAIIAVSLVLLYGLLPQNLFVMSFFLFKYGWWHISPYLLANMTALDPSGRLITATNFVISLGKALVRFMVCCVLFTPVAKSNDHLQERSRLQ
ncbi:MAG: hypothetical protein OXJ56_04275 [Rhodospirillaceae bacterium]|nr:hypothetical protein [Rhodospirillaceae bacterium]MDE0359602.1 hypothetical protein [Rhodospirillaceae bacterium]